jgi:3-oxoacyl-[acyl-carrier protein] reductase
MRFEGRVALVTGGSRGIGRAIVKALAREGAVVHFLYRSADDAAAALVREVEEAGGRAVGHKVDVTRHDELKQAVDEIQRAHGRLDLLVNNAGINRDNLALLMSVDEFRSVLETNLVSAFVLCQLAARQMMRRKSGAIVNMSSVAAHRPQVGHSNYACSKAALEAFTVSLAKEVAPKGIRVNCVAPGVIETEMMQSLIEKRGEEYLRRIPQARYGTPDDVSDLCLYLLSDEARYITGRSFAVDGGLGA